MRMPRGVQIIKVTSLRGRCRFVNFLKSITLNIFIENKRIRLYICIIVEQQYMCIFPEKFSVAYESKRYLKHPSNA